MKIDKKQELEELKKLLKQQEEDEEIERQIANTKFKLQSKTKMSKFIKSVKRLARGLTK